MGLLAKLHCLGTTAGAWLIEQAAGMRVDRVLAHKEALGDFAVAHSSGHEAKDLEFARSDSQFADSLPVRCKPCSCGRR